MMKAESIYKALGKVPLFIYLMATQIFTLSFEVRITILSLIIAIGLFSLYMRRGTVKKNENYPYYFLTGSLVLTALIFTFQYLQNTSNL